MFEKEAEDYMYSKIGVYKKSDTQEILLSFKDGAEFGYNKGRNEAKEIIREFVDWVNWQGNSKCPSFKSIQDKTEQFLKEIK